MKTPTKSAHASAGKRGEGVRSDCYVEIAAAASGGIQIELQSKVAALYGEKIEQLAREACGFYAIEHAALQIEDGGALPFTLAARLEAAIKRAWPDRQAAFQLSQNARVFSSSKKERLRRTRLYLPGNEPKFFVNAGLHEPDAIILDLEDSVAPSEKDAARILVRHALQHVDFREAERMVRINAGASGKEDLREVVPHGAQTILIPKCEIAEHVRALAEEVDALREQHVLSHEIFFIPIIESAAGVLRAFEIAQASDKNCGLAFGLEDYVADLGAIKTAAGTESLFARSMIVNAAKAAGLQALDSVFADVNDAEGLQASTRAAKALGFEGKGCIHPRQIRVIHEALAPSMQELEEAQRIVAAFEAAQQQGLGVIALGTKMIDAPVVKRARQILESARRNSITPS